MKQLIITILLIFAIMPSIKAQVSPIPPCPEDGKFEYDDFEKQVKEIKENCSYDLLPKYEARVNLCKTNPNPKRCLDEIMLNAFLEDNPTISLSDDEKKWLLDHDDILCQLPKIKLDYPDLDLDYVINVLTNGYGGVTLDEFKNTYEDFLDLDNPVDAPQKDIIQNGITVISTAVPSSDPIGPLIGENTYRHPQPSEDMSNSGTLSGINPFVPNEDWWMFAHMNNLFAATTILNTKLSVVSDEFVKRFKNNSSGEFFSSQLSENVKESPEMVNFIKIFAEKLNASLSRQNGDILKVPVIQLFLIRPKFDGLFNKFHGLQILINDTEQTKVYRLNDYSYDSNSKVWQCSFYFEILDHFGLDHHDAILYQGKHSGFAAWYRLQHDKKYLPFFTKIKIIATITGKLN